MSENVNIESILAPGRSHCKIKATSKKRTLEEISIELAATLSGINAEDLYSRLINREKIGTTAIGNGIAIPHCRLDQLDNIVGALFTLDQAIDFQAFDEEPVNL